MQLTIHTKNKFPHAFKLKTLGGSSSVDGKQYHWRYEEELSDEYSEIIETLETRAKHLGGSKKIHKIYEKRN